MSTDKESIDWYNENADEYTRHVRNADESTYHAYYEKPAMYNLLPSLNGKRVLSLGCGSGEDSQYLKTCGAAESIGIDISKKLIEIASVSYPDCKFLVKDMEDLSFDNESFDFIYSSLAIHYIENWTRVFSEVHRVLRPNSYFLFSCGHPIRSAMEVTVDTDTELVRFLGHVKNNETKETRVVGDYLNRKKINDTLRNDARVTSWHKPISEIVSEARKSGFLIENFVEPLPLQQMSSTSPQSYAKLSKIPEFMIFRLLKA